MYVFEGELKLNFMKKPKEHVKEIHNGMTPDE